MAADILEVILKAAQQCVQQHPVLVLGSGASASYGLRGMPALAQHLVTNVSVANAEEEEIWDSVKADLLSDKGLEETLLRYSTPAPLVRQVVQKTWEAIAEDDLLLMYKASRRNVEFSLSRMLNGMFRSTHKVISIVTTNYDRVAEYACDLAGYSHLTGFTQGIIRTRRLDEHTSYIRNQEQRRVQIWKVHGSLDWFMDDNDVPVCLPLSTKVPDGFSPLIVTPGMSKFERTHEEPFRSAIQGADAAINRANGIVCIGYGFRDTHVQPKIIERCRNGNVPLVVLAKELTRETHDFLKRAGGSSWLALEECGDGTRCFSPNHPDGIVIEHRDIWSFQGFNESVF